MTLNSSHCNHDMAYAGLTQAELFIIADEWHCALLYTFYIFILSPKYISVIQHIISLN